MATPGNQELLEMIKFLEQRIVEQQETIVELRGKITMIENDLDDVDARTNRFIENTAMRRDVNDSLNTLVRIGALNKVDIRRGLL
tara:strand:- start:284 stop:538 length:255 start_codon:yes stop_codon:yes gene_type:complete